MIITGEAKTATKDNSLTITWLTSHFSTSRVVYDTVSGKFDAKSVSPAYGFGYYKEGDDSGLEKVTFHSVTLTDLIPNATYYYRTVSVGSLAISPEYSFVAPIAASASAITPAVAPIVSATNPAPVSFAVPAASAPASNTNSGAEQPIIEAGNAETSIVDYLSLAGKPGDFDSRARLAEQNGIANYTGSAEQNLNLLGLLKNAAPQEIAAEEIEKAPESQNQEKSEPAEIKTPETKEAAEQAIENIPAAEEKDRPGLSALAGSNTSLWGKISLSAWAVILLLLGSAAFLVKKYWLKKD